jgi:AMP-polyphosphate phosphotransferase
VLEKIDLTKKIKKEEYKSINSQLQIKLGELQRKVREQKIPVIIAFEGWDAAGKGTMINQLILTLDPRGFTVHPINPPNIEEKHRPFLWRFWIKTPGKGRIAVFDRSWYGRVLVERVNKIVKKSIWSKAYDEIKSFERQLVDDGAVIIKFFLHIDKNKQKKRFKILEKNPSTAWKVTKDDWKHHKQYDKYFNAIEGMLAKTDTEFAPWSIVEAHDRRFATIKVYKTIIDAIERKIYENEQKEEIKKTFVESTIDLNHISSSVLDKVDLSVSLTREDYDKELKKYQARIMELEHEVYVKRIPVMMVYEGWDAAGKGGNIKRLVRGMDPRGYEVIPIAAPNGVELAHHYLWRFWDKIPKAGHIAIFDRSWYGRVLVERIEGFCSEEEWKRAFREINEMEEHLVNFGTVLIKFWVHIDQEEQLNRFESRKQIPHKQWKITDEDWRNREKWEEYKTAVDDMLFKTSTSYAPWTIVESNSKLYARIKAIKTVVESLEKRL